MEDLMPNHPPIFIVGMPRSGSTIFHRIMAAHPHVVTTTNHSRKAPANPTLLRLIRRIPRVLPDEKPGELGSMWDRFNQGGSDVMNADDVTDAARRFYRNVVQTHLEVYPGDVFIAKCPRLGLRIEFLKAIFPNARFIHLIRDGRGVCLSVLRRREGADGRNTWWDARPQNWRDLEQLDPVSSIAHQWLEVVTHIRNAGAEIGGDYLEITYEHLIENPVETLRAVGEFCALDCPAPEQKPLIDSLQSQNDKWRKAYSENEINVLNRIMAPLLNHYGYLEQNVSS